MAEKVDIPAHPSIGDTGCQGFAPQAVGKMGMSAAGWKTGSCLRKVICEELVGLEIRKELG